MYANRPFSEGETQMMTKLEKNAQSYYILEILGFILTKGTDVIEDFS